MDTLTKTLTGSAEPQREITDAAWASFRENCQRIVARGGEEGAIAADMLRIDDRLTAAIEKAEAFLAS